MNYMDMKLRQRLVLDSGPIDRTQEAEMFYQSYGTRGVSTVWWFEKLAFLGRTRDTMDKSPTPVASLRKVPG